MMELSDGISSAPTFLTRRYSQMPDYMDLRRMLATEVSMLTWLVSWISEQGQENKKSFRDLQNSGGPKEGTCIWAKTGRFGNFSCCAC